MADTIYIIAGQTVDLSLEVLDANGDPLDVSSDYTIVYTLVRGSDPSATVVTRSSGGSGLTGLDMSQAATGLVTSKLVHAQTSAMATGLYTAQWEVTDDNSPEDVFKVEGESIRVKAPDYTS